MISLDCSGGSVMVVSFNLKTSIMRAPLLKLYRRRTVAATRNSDAEEKTTAAKRGFQFLFDQVSCVGSI
ncbi:hypothetical protein M8C21_029473, partial [Ambrosia artemisiifolia]